MNKCHNLGRALAEIIVVACLAIRASDGQKPLQKRGGAVDPEIQTIYDSPQYENAYLHAQIIYSDTKPDLYTPTPWDPHKRPSWAAYTEDQLQTYSRNFRAFKHQLEVTSDIPQNRTNPTRIAQISVIQNRLTSDTMDQLNVMVESLNLGKLFIDDHQPAMAKLWAPWQPQATKRVLDNARMAEVLQFLENIDNCLTESQSDQLLTTMSVRQKQKNAKGKQLSPKEAKSLAQSFWQPSNRAKVDNAFVKSIEALNKAKKVAAVEGLLDEPLP